MLSVKDALERVLDGVTPLALERAALLAARGRVLGEAILARRTQPGFDASAMDGYALRASEAGKGARLSVVGEAAAGRAFVGAIGTGEAVRIFTGAPVPAGADAVLIQENARREGTAVIVEAPLSPGQNIRPAGLDFRKGDTMLGAGMVLGARDLALAAAANHPDLPVRRRPRVALLATGDEIVPPGQPVGPSQIVASNTYALAAIIECEGGEVIDLGIAGDDFPSLERAIRRASDEAADILVTIGGASVGDHDLVQAALRNEGMELGFWRIAMRPGKPMMHGRLGPMRILGLPGNPVSAIVCGVLFLVPLTRALLGRAEANLPRGRAQFAVAWPANDLREDYLRARLERRQDPLLPLATPFSLQDSSMVSVLAASDCLVVRPPHAPAARMGDPCEIIDLRLAGL
jgi:molybdopterin molybdotransferase